MKTAIWHLGLVVLCLHLSQGAFAADVASYVGATPQNSISSSGSFFHPSLTKAN